MRYQDLQIPDKIRKSKWIGGREKEKVSKRIARRNNSPSKRSLLHPIYTIFNKITSVLLSLSIAFILFYLLHYFNVQLCTLLNFVTGNKYTNILIISVYLLLVM
eukprot:192561_1